MTEETTKNGAGEKYKYWMISFAVAAAATWVFWVTTFVLSGPFYSEASIDLIAERLGADIRISSSNLRSEMMERFNALPPPETRAQIARNSLLLQDQRGHIISMQKDLDDLLRHLEKRPVEMLKTKDP